MPTRKRLPSDREVIDLATELIAGLNARYGRGPLLPAESPPQWNPSEGRWMGWERKRGKLHEFNRAAAGRRRHDVRHPGRRPRSAAERALRHHARLRHGSAARCRTEARRHACASAEPRPLRQRIGPRHRRLRRASAARRDRRGQRGGDDVLAGVFGARRARPVHDRGVGRVSGSVRRGQLRRQRHLRRRRVRAGAAAAGSRTTRC